MPVHVAAPWRPVNEVELLGKKKIKIEDAQVRLRAFLDEQSSNGAPAKVSADSQGADSNKAKIKLRQLPDLLESLEMHWVDTKGDQRPSECFIEVKGRLEVHMHPSFMGAGLQEGLRSHMSELLLQYNPSLGCMPICYRGLKPTGSHGAIVGESPYLHFTVDFEAVGFAPAEGQWLLGKLQQTAGAQTWRGVSLLALGHISCLAPYDSLPSEVRFDGVQNSWVEGQGELLTKDNRPVFVKVSRVDKVNNLSITGAMAWPPLTKRLGDGADEPKASATASAAPAVTLQPGGPAGKRQKTAKTASA